MRFSDTAVAAFCVSCAVLVDDSMRLVMRNILCDSADCRRWLRRSPAEYDFPYMWQIRSVEKCDFPYMWQFSENKSR